MTTLEGVDPQMIANNLKPFQPTHPGEVLKDELEYRGISQRGLAKEIGISYIAFVDEHYDYCHTQSFHSMVADMAEYCHRKGGALV
jgi:hypothetical protein